MIHRLLLLGVLATLSVGALVAPATGAPAELERTRKELAAIRGRIETARASLADQKRREDALHSDLQRVETTRQQLADQVAVLRARLARLQKKITVQEGRAETLRRSLAKRRGKIRQRLVAIYKSGDEGLLRILFAAGSPARMAKDYALLGRVVRHDRELLSDYRQRLSERETVLARLETLRGKQQQVLAENREQQRTLSAAVTVKNQLLAALRRKGATLSHKLERLQTDARRLATLLKDLESQKSAAYTGEPDHFSRQQGHLPWPAPGKIAVHFGTGRHPDLGTLFESQGIEIDCGPDRPVRAVWGGAVAFAKEFQGYGKLLIVDHGGSFYTLYAHLARLEKKVGARVGRGEELARSAGGGARLYFEIRHNGKPLNPEQWLAPR